MVEIAKNFDIKICEVPETWLNTTFYSSELNALFVPLSLNEEDKMMILEKLLDQLGILPPPR